MDMTMSTTTAMASMTMTSASSMASSTSGMDMDSSSMSMMMTSADMAMVFFQSVTTPLYSSAWTPQGQGSYAGTCIFLIVLALVHRILIAGRSIVFSSTPVIPRSRKGISSDSHSDEYPGSNSDLESMGARFRSQWSSHPFKVATETARALLEVIIGGIGYLLMLAVMTMNVGYFLSVLGGIFLGTFVAGRFGGSDDHH